MSSEGFSSIEKNAMICPQRDVLPIRVSRIVCRGQVGPKSSKSTLRPDFHASTWPMLFFKNNVNTRNRREVVRKSVVNGVWKLRGQESPLMNKNGLVWTMLSYHWSNLSLFFPPKPPSASLNHVCLWIQCSLWSSALFDEKQTIWNTTLQIYN